MHLRCRAFLSAVTPLAVSGVLLAGCASQGIPIEVKRPALYTDAANVKKVAVVHFNGPSGDFVAARLEASLASAKVNGRPFFDVTSGQARAQQVGLRHSSRATGFDKEAARQLGRSLGVDGVYGGDVITNGVVSQTYSEKRSKPTGCSGKGIVQKCTGSVEYSVTCVKRIANVSISVRLVEVSTGRTPYSNTHTGEYSDTGCEGVLVASEQELLERALGTAIDKIRRDVAPVEEKIAVKFQLSPKRLDGQKRETFTKALEWIKAGDAVKGCQIWEQLLSEGARDPYLLFNLAVCDEANNKLEAAEAKLQEAKNMSSDPDAVIIAAHKKYQKMIQERDAIKNQTVARRA